MRWKKKKKRSSRVLGTQPLYTSIGRFRARHQLNEVCSRLCKAATHLPSLFRSLEDRADGGREHDTHYSVDHETSTRGFAGKGGKGNNDCEITKSYARRTASPLSSFLHVSMILATILTPRDHVQRPHHTIVLVTVRFPPGAASRGSCWIKDMRMFRVARGLS